MGRLNSCFFLAALSVSYQNHTEAVAHGTDPVPPTETTPPNIILILMDDVGYSDFGCYGSEIQTPHIDWLASQGLRLRNFYNQARSAPTRASLLTGLYPHQVGYGSLKRFPGIPAYQGYVNDKNLFIPELLEEKGYMNIMTGKWHLGSDKGVTPLKRGFHRSLDMQAGGYYFYNDPDGKLNLNDESIRLDDPRLPAAWYSTDLFTTVGLEFLDEALEQQKPFFWYLAFNGAHFPLQAPPDQISKYKGKYLDGWEAVRKRRFDKQLQIGLFEDAAQLTPLNPKSPDWDTLTSSEKERYDTQMAIYASIIDVMDQNIGRIISYLEEHDILDNTLILILSDNGGNAEPGMEGRFVGPDPGAVGSIVYLGGSWADAANTPYLLYKHHAHEGGCNTPLIVFYPNGMERSVCGSINKSYYGHVIDIMPTLAELVGAEYPQSNNGVAIPPMEGQSFLPLLKGRNLHNDRGILVEHEGNKMYRQGKWKIVQEFQEEKWRLYDMEKTPTETEDLSAAYPYVLNYMIGAYFDKAGQIGVETELDDFVVGKWYSPVESYFGE